MEIKRRINLKLAPYSENKFFSLLLSNDTYAKLKVLDIIFFKRNNNQRKCASLWYYTNENGQFRFRDLQLMEVAEFVLAILCNINGNEELRYDSILV